MGIYIMCTFIANEVGNWSVLYESNAPRVSGNYLILLPVLLQPIYQLALAT